MEINPISFTYKGETVLIKPGNVFTKLELISRLNEMKFPVDSSFNKNLLVEIYESAINIDNNKLLIFHRLKKDTDYFRSKYNFQKKIINYENTTNNINSRKYYFGTDNKINNYEDEEDDGDDSLMSNNENSSFCRKILKFINNHKIDIIEKLFYLVLIFSVDAFLKNYAKKNYLLGKIIMPVRNVITPRRLIFGFLLFTVVKYILNMFFYYLFGFGVLTFMYLIFKDKITDFINNIFN